MPVEHLVIDDRSGPAPAPWRFFTDAVMGGVSEGRMAGEVVAGRPALCLRGQVRLENNGGFIQMALPVRPPSGDWQAIELDVFGNGHRYGLHLRTADMELPWQAWRGTFFAGPAWQTVRLPLADFAPYRSTGVLTSGNVRRIGILALGERFDADVCIARLAWAR